MPLSIPGAMVMAAAAIRQIGGWPPASVARAGRHLRLPSSQPRHHLIQIRAAASETDQQSATMASKTRVAVIFYSAYGHVKTLAEKVVAGVNSVQGVEGSLFQVAETLPPNIVELMKAPPKPWPEIPVMEPNKLPEYDGFLFGIPTRFGMMPAQMKALFDATGGLWVKGSLVGKPAGVFVSVGTQGGGIETTALTSVTQFAHHGMIFVPCGYSFGELMQDLSEVHAATSYGACTYAGANGERQPSQFELDYSRYQGEYFAKVAQKLAGKGSQPTQADGH